MNTDVRELNLVTSGQKSMDGDGVQLTRLIGSNQLDMLDPFLLLDSFESDKPKDYLGGFPSHPHRGFETVTYMLEGKMRHKDSIGNEGVINAGGVQWMTAGKGVIHSEMPEQSNGLLHGFQLWVNLPKSHKMVEPTYQEFPAIDISVDDSIAGVEARVVAGKTDTGAEGIVQNEHVLPTYLDVNLDQETTFIQTVPTHHNAFIYVINGALCVGDRKEGLKYGQLGTLTQGEQVKLVATERDTRFLLIAGKPLNEPVARGGPFVMNTKQEIMQAFEDFSQNRF